jgi:hypothetical protein
MIACDGAGRAPALRSARGLSAAVADTLAAWTLTLRWTLFLALLAASCTKAAPPTPADAGPEEPNEAVQRILTTKEFPFCESSSTQLRGDSRRWCTIRDEATTCPALREHCAALTSEEPSKATRSFYDRAVDRAQKLIEGESGGALDHTRSLDFNLPAFRGISAVIWAMLALLLGAVLAWIAREILRHRGASGGEIRPATVPELGVFELASPALGEVGELLARARAESQHDVKRALACLYAATLKHLEQVGLIRWERSTTNRSYVRAVRGKTALDEPLRDLVREVELSQFGHVAPPDRPVFDRLYARIAALIPGAMLLLVAFHVTACDLGDPGVDGHAAFNELLKSQGITPKRLSVPLDKWTKTDPPVLIDGGRIPIDEGMLDAISDTIDKGGRILLLVRSEQSFPGWPSIAIRSGTARTFHAARTWAAAMGLQPGINGVLPGGREIVPIADPDAEEDSEEGDGPPPDVLLEREGHPFAMRWSSDDGDGELVVVADRDLFANAALAVPGNATLALAIAREVVGPSHELATAMLGFENAAESPEDSLLKAGLWPFVLQGMLALAIFFWARGAAFGKLRDRAWRPRRAFAEHVAALGRQFTRGGGSRYAASLYAGYALDRLRRRVGADADHRAPEPLARTLAPTLGRPEAELAALFRTAEAYRQEPAGAAHPRQDLALIRQLDAVVRALPGTVGTDGRPARLTGAARPYTTGSPAGKDEAPTLATGTSPQ